MPQGESTFEKKYDLITAVAMVVGIVIGGGVFFKAEKILNATGGNLPIGILAWIIGGGVMVICAYVFAILATKHEKATGVVDYAEKAWGKSYGYFMGWFMALIYYPTLAISLCYISARYTTILFGGNVYSGKTVALAAFYLIISYALNALAPVIAGKVQVTTTIIKLIPLLGMAVVGIIAGLINGLTVQNFTTTVTDMPVSHALFAAVIATTFAYEGWIIATSISAELKDAKKNLPRALLIGTLITVVVYVLYYIGLAGGITNQEMMASGERGALVAFSTIFSHFGGSILMVFVLISCLGTLNGVMLGCTRGVYSLAVRDMGPAPQIFKQIDPATNMATNSSIFGLLVCSCWFLYYYLANFINNATLASITFDITELPIITIYALYIPIFIKLMVNGKELSPIKRFITPILAICSCIFIVFAACYVHRIKTIWYLVLFTGIMLFGFLCKNLSKYGKGK